MIYLDNVIMLKIGSTPQMEVSSFMLVKTERCRNIRSSTSSDMTQKEEAIS